MDKRIWSTTDVNHVFIILRNYSCKILLYPVIVQGTIIII